MNEDILSMLGNKEPQEKPMEKDDGEIDTSVLSSMMTADGADGNFEIKPKEKPAEEKQNITITTGKVKEKLGKYSKEFIQDVIKHPTKYSVKTSRGEMSIKDAINQGWDAKTGEFNEASSFNKQKEDALSKLNQSDRDSVETLTNPANAHMAVADAEKAGIDADSGLVDQPPEAMQAMQAGGQAGEQQAAPPIDPEILKQMLGGKL